MKKKPKILLSKTDSNYFVKEIIQSDRIYVVLYDNKPFNYKISNKLLDNHVPKYRKTVFPNPGFAKNLAKKLNRMFHTDKFTVKEIQF